MVALAQQIDPNFQAEGGGERRDFEPLSAGEYTLQAVESQIRKSQAGNDRLTITFEVVDGPRPGAKVFEGYNIDHPKANVQQIAYEQLGRLASACGLGPVGDTDDLNYIPFRALLKVEPARDQFAARNAIAKYLPPKAAAAPAPRAVAPAAAPARQRPAPVGAATAAPGARPRPWAGNGQPRQIEGDPPY